MVLEDTSLYDFHETLQRVMGWQNYHLHMFKIAGQIYGDPEDDECGEIGTKNEKRYHLIGLLTTRNSLAASEAQGSTFTTL